MFAHPGDRAALSPFPVADMHRDPNAELTSKLPVLDRDFRRRELRATGRERHRDKLIIGREVAVTQPEHVAIMRNCTGHVPH